MPRKPGGKYKGKVGRAKGAETIAAELELKRRRAYEANLAKLQDRRQQDLLAEHGMQSAEEEAQALKMAKIAQMFGQGKKGTLRKFWGNWKIGMIMSRKEKTLEERKTNWRRSCDLCAPVDVDDANRHGQFGKPHMCKCKAWWTHSLGRENWGEEAHPKEAAFDRPEVVNQYRACLCCGADTGLPGLGCRCWYALRDSGFMNPSEAAKKTAGGLGKSVTFQPNTPSMLNKMSGMLTRSASAPQGMSPKQVKAARSKVSLSVEQNWNTLRRPATVGAVPEYDPSEAFVLTKDQAFEENRRGWSNELSEMAGSPVSRKRSGTIGLTPGALMDKGYSDATLPALKTTVPRASCKGKKLSEATHWRTGQKTMLDQHMMKMYVVGVQ